MPRRADRFAFETVRSEGALLPPDLLGRIAAGDRELPGLRPEDYHLARGERLGEVTSRSWNRLLGAWAGFRDARERLGRGEAAARLTRERWLGVLFQELGYGRLEAARGATVLGGEGGRAYPISHFWRCVPIHLVGFNTDLDRRRPGVAGAARQSPHGLVQEFLNRSDEHLFGIASNGLRLRLLRDNASLTRQAYLEFDLEAMFEGERYADFALLWLVLHQSRLEPRPVAPEAPPRPEGCWLERWREIARDQGVRALDRLRQGVERAVEALGQGFLAHPANRELRRALASGALPTEDYYRELLRLVYRLLFLCAAEDRDLLLLPEAEAKPEARARYREHYSLARLRRLAERRRGGPHPDLYRGLRVVMDRLGSERGCPELALPALGSFLWSAEALPHLGTAELANRSLLEAVRALAFTEDDRRLRPVDYRNLGSEELGSVYESLLELHPEVEAEAARFRLATAAGHERKTTGSYYTPTSLIDCLLDSALEPLLAEAAAAGDPEAAILGLRICDPAAGSGHFLVAAAHRMARALAAVRSGEEEPPPEALRRALRDVIGRCLYGVDLNPMAVELCKVSLWLEALEPGRPLSFLEHHIRCGNSLLGATPALLARGIPDDAWKPIEGDDKGVAAALRKQNRQERRGQTALFADLARDAAPAYGSLSEAVAALDALPDDSPEAVREKEARWRALAASEEARREGLRADAWCAAFVWPKRAGAPEPPTEDLYRRLSENPETVPAKTVEEIRRLAREYRFFHWHLAFPDVFRAPDKPPADGDPAGWEGGFDLVLGNPPWERIKLQEKEFFASRHPEIAGARNKAARERLIARLEAEDPALYAAFLEARRHAEGESHLVRDSGRYPLCGRGDVNTYAVFAELMTRLTSGRGRVGAILPSGIATDDTYKDFFRTITERRQLRFLFHFDNRAKLFRDVGPMITFCLLSLVGAERPVEGGAEYAFFVHDPAELREPERRFRLSPEDIALLNPNTRTCPIFRSRRDAELTKWIYRRVPVLVREGPPEENPWGVSFMTMFHMSNDSDLFRTREQLEAGGGRLRGNAFEVPPPGRPDGPSPVAPGRWLPLYEAKMVHHYDHRWATWEGEKPRDLTVAEKQDPAFLPLPRYWVPETEVESRLAGRWPHPWLLGWRDICRSTDERTVIASVVPRVGVGNNLPVSILGGEPSLVPGLVACIASFPLDYAARFKVGGTHLNFFIAHQIPVVPPRTLQMSSLWAPDCSLADWLRPRVLELTYTAWDLAPFARELGWEGPPFRWDEERRFQLRCELDAAFFHLYLGPAEAWEREAPEELRATLPTPRDAVAYILETFPIVRRNDERAHGRYRTRDTVLEIYDDLDRAAATGVPWESPLDPPPGDPRAAHAEGGELPPERTGESG